MATSAITPPRTRRWARMARWAHIVRARAVFMPHASWRTRARYVARFTLQVVASCIPFILAAWLVYPMSPAGVLLAGVAGLLAGVWLGAWLATPDQPRADRSRADRPSADRQGPSDGGRADV